MNLELEYLRRVRRGCLCFSRSWPAIKTRFSTVARSYWRSSRVYRSRVFGWKWLRRLASAGLFVASCTGFTGAASPDQALSQYVYDSWGIEKGFPNETITSIAQTSDGYLWIGTDKSLIRFDGLNFQKYPQAIPASFPINAVQSLVSDDKGNLWIL